MRSILSRFDPSRLWPSRAGGRLRYAGVQLGSRYQPIVSATGEIVGYEALLAVLDSPATSPTAIIQRAARDGHVALIDIAAIDIHLNNWRGWSGETLYLNLHPETLARFGAGPVLDALDQHGVAPERIVIELLESVAGDMESVKSATRILRDAGASIAIDDFGAGHSNLLRLWELEPEIVKLDRSMVSMATGDDRLAETLGRVVALIHDMNALAIAEGIETRPHRDIARAAGADWLQGYLYGMPTPFGLGVCGSGDMVDCVSTKSRRTP